MKTHTLIFLIIMLSMFSCEREITDSQGPSNVVQIDMEKAKQVVINDLIGIDTIGKIVWIYPTILKRGEPIYISSNINRSYSVDFDSWFFYIDDFADFPYPTPCRYVFINALNGQNTVMNENACPLLFHEGQMQFVKLWYAPNRVESDEAIEIVVNQVILPDTLYRRVYFFPEILPKGNMIVVAGKPNNIYGVDYDSWFFFIDDNCWGDYEHACRYVFVGIRTGETTVFNENYFPGILGFMETVRSWNCP